MSDTVQDRGYTTGKATLIFKGLTLEQAKCFASWYEGQAEQDTTWFEESGIPAPMSNVREGKYMVVDEKTETVTCRLHTPPDDTLEIPDNPNPSR